MSAAISDSSSQAHSNVGSGSGGGVIPNQPAGTATTQNNLLAKLRPAIIAGLLLGVVTHIPVLGFFPAGWAIAGGSLATYLYGRKPARRIPLIEGIMVGCIAGVTASILYGIIAGIVVLVGLAISSTQAQDPFGFSSGPSLRALGSAAVAYISVLIMGGVLPLFAALGGVIGVPLFGLSRE